MLAEEAVRASASVTAVACYTSWQAARVTERATESEASGCGQWERRLLLQWQVEC